ncbi:MAG: hypothetical protein J1F18_13440 [Lachnospiraceae bacterium]|nr:hypothetical protein [Lachnospiraceae bacterium]
MNAAIVLGQIEKADEIHSNYIKSRLYSTGKYNEWEAIICLRDACEDHHFYNTKSWIERKETKDKIKFPNEKRIISKVVFDCSLKFNSKSKKLIMP